MEVIGGIAFLGMMITMGREGKNYGTDKANIDVAVEAAKKRQADTAKQFEAILTQQVVLDEKLKTEIVNNIDQLDQLQAQLQVTRWNAVARFAAIQTAGVVFIAVVIFLYILKAFGFLHDINEAVAGLFRGRK